MMNPNTLLELARERSRDLLDDAARSRHHVGREAGPLDSEDASLSGGSARLIDARVRAQARLRAACAALDLP